MTFTAPVPEAAVLARVKTLASAALRPVLEDAVVIQVVQAHPLPDLVGATITQDGWTPTWNVYAAVAELWNIKAGMVAADFDFTADSGSYSKGDVMAHMLAMRDSYAAKVSGSTDTSHFRYDPLCGVVVNG